MPRASDPYDTYKYASVDIHVEIHVVQHQAYQLSGSAFYSLALVISGRAGTANATGRHLHRGSEYQTYNVDELNFGELVVDSHTARRIC
jgi:hypothetical protein